MAMSNPLEDSSASLNDLIEVNKLTAEYALEIVSKVENGKLNSNQGIALINDRIVAIEKQMQLPGGKLFVPLRLLCVQLRDRLLNKHCS